MNNNEKQFSVENTMMSVGGHLAVMALMVTTFVLIVENTPPLVATDRVQIFEIDLSQVKVTGTETALYNTDVLPPVGGEKDAAPVVEQPKDAVPEPEEIGDEEPIDAPTMVESAPPAESDKVETAANKEENTSNTNAPIKKTVVRVNREVRTLNRTMTISVVDALRVALTRCWVIDTKRNDISDIRAVAHLVMSKNGMVRDVWFESAPRADSDPAFAYVLETIRSALNTCQPFKMLPESEFEHWEKIELTFYPTQGKIM